MKVSLNWLSDYTDINADAKKYADMMTMSGTKVEAIDVQGEGLKNLVIGQIKEISPHPDADKLIITQIDIGKEEWVQIVTGASNVSVGDIIPVALDGSVLPNGTKIKKGKLRGIDSNGMLCSGDELGIDNKYVNEKSKDGILILEDEFTIGDNAVDALLLEDIVIEFEVTANRPDCRSILGIAKESSATLGTEYKTPDTSIQNSVKGQLSVKIEVEDEDLCPRFVMREIKDIKIKPSPQWMQKRLISYGIRPINNIVDITNYVMAEYGQPLHAYDVDKLDTDKILVRRAKEGEKITTLDQKEFDLDPNVLLITDGEKPIGMAGVMGGANSQITKDTKHILLEAALFDADNVRLTSRRLGIRTDASSAFEKGIDIQRQRNAVDRACHLIELLGAGTIIDHVADTYEKEYENTIIKTELSYINGLIGEEIPRDTVIAILEKLFFKVGVYGDNIEIIVPAERLDMTIREDVVEEVARLYGYNNIISKPIVASVTQALKSVERQFEDRLKKLSQENGLTEIQTYSFVSPKNIEKINSTDEKHQRILKLLNPLGEETSVMRTTLIPGMLEVVATNLSHKNEEYSAFELGNNFFKSEGEELPTEEKALVAGMYGAKEDFFTAKARLEGILKGIGITEAKYVTQTENKTYHPGRCADVYSKNTHIATIGEIHPKVLESFGIKKRVNVFEINIKEARKSADLEVRYSPVPRYPAIEKDIALVVDKDLQVGELEEIIKKYGKKNLESVKLFDIFIGDQVGENKKSVAYALTFRASDRTLTDEEVNKIQDKILTQLEIEAGAKLR